MTVPRLTPKNWNLLNRHSTQKVRVGWSKMEDINPTQTQTSSRIPFSLAADPNYPRYVYADGEEQLHPLFWDENSVDSIHWALGAHPLL